MVRGLCVAAVALLVACGGGDKDTDTSSGATGSATGGTATGGTAGTGTPTGTTGAGTGTGGTDCAFGGMVDGCLAYEAECDTPDASYTVAGGWFDDSQAGTMVLHFADNPSSQYWELVVTTAEIAVGEEYTYPANVSGKLVDVSNPDTTAITTVCAGRVVITDWEPGVTVSGRWLTQAELGMGPCIDNQFWASSGTFTELLPCRQ